MGRPSKMKRRAEKYERIGSENPTVGITASWEPPKSNQQSAMGRRNQTVQHLPEDPSYTSSQIEILRIKGQRETTAWGWSHQPYCLKVGFRSLWDRSADSTWVVYIWSKDKALILSSMRPGGWAQFVLFWCFHLLFLSLYPRDPGFCPGST